MTPHRRLKLKAIIRSLEQGLIERGQCVRLCLLAALLAGRHRSESTNDSLDEP